MHQRSVQNSPGFLAEFSSVRKMPDSKAETARMKQKGSACAPINHRKIFIIHKELGKVFKKILL